MHSHKEKTYPNLPLTDNGMFNVEYFRSAIRDVFVEFDFCF